MYYPSIRYDMFHSARSTGDADAQAIIDAMPTTPDAARQALITTLVTSGKSHGWWVLLEWLHVYAAHERPSALLNWKNPGTFDGATYVSGTPSAVAPAFTIDRGFENSNLTQHIRPGYNPFTDAIGLGASDNGMFGGIGTDIVDGNKSMMGFTGTNAYLLNPKNSSTTTARTFDNGTANSVANTNSIAHFGAFRTGNTSEIYKNKVQTQSTISGATIPNVDIFVMARNVAGSPNYGLLGQLRYAGMSTYFTQTIWEHFVDDMETYLDAIGAGLI